MRGTFLRICLVLGAGLLWAGSGWAADAPAGVPAEHARFFQTKVLPLLVDNCQSCHGEKRQKGGLRLDSAQAVRKGGKDGVILVPGKPEASKIITAVSYKDNYLQMPPDDRLSESQVEILTQWVRMGAPWAGDAVAQGTQPPRISKRRIITDEDRKFWSFQPPRDFPPPVVADGGWCRNDIDRFIFAKLAAEGVAPAPRADKATLVRRAYLDALGLPPTPQQVGEFVNDSSPDAWEKLVDRLLASPRYGERMARHWLDLVRYAESDGYKADGFRPNVWPYRDYVIRSFNDDKPYNRFLSEQIAGDELNPDDPNVIIGTEFMRNGMYEYNQRDVKKHWQTIVDEMTDVTSDAFLGLSMGCAKCHDHKFDPILQSDYYRLEAFFSPLLPKQDMVLATTEEKSRYEEKLKIWQEKTADIRAQLDAIEGPFIKRAAEAQIIKFPDDIQAIIRKPAAQRTPYEEQIAQLAGRQAYDKTDSGAVKVSGPQKRKHEELVRKLAEFDNIKPKPLQTSLMVGDVGLVAPPTYIPGDKSRHDVGTGFPTVLSNQPLITPEIKATSDSTGRRTALAQWLTQPNHPLTTRVIVNRLWQYHFGRGIVGTSSDFGKLGDRPSHPQLLDYLAVKLVKNNWQLKSIHRLIMTSAAYQQNSTRAMPAEKSKDPEDRLLWKYPARRLDAEQIRDTMLLVSGELKLDAYGPGVDPSNPRLSIYTKVVRNNRDPLLEAFDVPDTFSSSADRNRTTTPTQSLLLINGDVALKRAEMFAERLQGMGLKTPAETVDAAWKLAYSRPPTDRERQLAVNFLSRPAPLAVDAKPQHADLNTGHFASKSIDDKPLVKNMPQLGSQAIYIRNARIDDTLRLPRPVGMPAEDFTVEAYVLLDSIYDDASMRVIASQWDGNNAHPGWSLGVTGAKSKYGPQNLILQVACGPKQAGSGYEVIHSDFRIELHRTYYVAVSLRMKDTGESGATFYLKDISDMDAPLKSVSIAHKVTGALATPSALVIGGRDTAGPAKMQGWDGLIDEVRISKTALTKEDLLYTEGHPPKQAICGHWVFEDQPGLFKDSAGLQSDLIKPAAASAARKADTNLIDFCHVLLNSNRFLYMD
jgi:hypothetical protein